MVINDKQNVEKCHLIECLIQVQFYYSDTGLYLRQFNFMCLLILSVKLKMTEHIFDNMHGLTSTQLSIQANISLSWSDQSRVKFICRQMFLPSTHAGKQLCLNWPKICRYGKQCTVGLSVFFLRYIYGNSRYVLCFARFL